MVIFLESNIESVFFIFLRAVKNSRENDKWCYVPWHNCQQVHFHGSESSLFYLLFHHGGHNSSLIHSLSHHGFLRHVHHVILFLHGSKRADLFDTIHVLIRCTRVLMHLHFEGRHLLIIIILI